MAIYKLTIRRGPKVSRQKYEKRADAIAALQSLAQSVIDEGGLETVQMIRTFEPGDRVAARLEISKGGWMGNTAGVDVMGDGRVIAFTGGVLRKPLDPKPSETPYDAVRRVI